MPTRRNNNHDLKVTVKELVKRTSNGATTPHGVKTVDPDEGLNLMSAAGSFIRWDYSTASAWKSAIEYGTDQIERTKLQLDTAQIEIDLAKERVADAETHLTDLDARVGEAQQDITKTGENLTALQSTVGDVGAAAARAQADAADALLLGFDKNVVPSNGDGSSSVGWEAFGWNTSGPEANNGNPGSYWVQGRKSVRTDRFPATPGKYSFSVSVKASIPGTRFYVQVLRYNAAGESLAPNPYLVVNSEPPSGSWKTWTGTTDIAEGTTHAYLQIHAMHSNGAQDPTAYQWFTGVSLRRLIPGALVVNGSITGEQIDASSVAAKTGSFLSIEAMTGVFKAGLTTNEATLLGTTVAESLKVKKLVGNTMIATGSIDTPQLNVTESMSAAIVDAMSVATKKLVVTEDAILNRATVVKGLVTSELITQKADINTLAANMITAGALAVYAADGSGIAMVPEGFLAFDANKMATMLINGRYNAITGDLQTGTKGSRARISTRQGTSAIDFFGTSQAHGGVWYDDSPNRMTIAAMPDGGYNPATSASMSFHSDSRSVKFNAAVDISHGQQHGYVTFNSPGLTAGQSSAFTIKFGGSLAAGAKPFAYFTPEASSGASLVCTLRSITETEMQVTLRNLSSFNSGLIYLWWTVVARTKYW